MIPTALVAGLVAGLATRTWWSIPVLAVGWVAVVAIGAGTAVTLGELLGAAALGAVNVAVGVAVGRGIRSMVARRQAQ